MALAPPRCEDVPANAATLQSDHSGSRSSTPVDRYRAEPALRPRGDAPASHCSCRCQYSPIAAQTHHDQPQAYVGYLSTDPRSWTRQYSMALDLSDKNMRSLMPIRSEVSDAHGIRLRHNAEYQGITRTRALP